MSRVSLVAGLAVALALVGCHPRVGPTTVASADVRPPPSVDDVLAAIASALPPLSRRTSVLEGAAAPSEPSLTEDPTLAEEVAAGTYVAFDVGIFHVRLPTSDAVMIPYVHALIEQAGQVLTHRYGAAPAAVRLDYYADRARFEARLGGRTPFDVDGAYARGTVVALSPSGGAGNWGETLVHELSHAHQDAAAPGSGAAWLREGFAESDASRFRPEWHRELDCELAEILGAAPDRALERIARAVDHPASARALGGAYAAAGEFAAFLDRTRGAGVAARLFAELATQASADTALTRVAGMSTTTLGAEFVDDLGPRLAAARSAHLPLAFSESATDGPASVAAAAMLEGRIDAARSAADALLLTDPRDTLALEVRLRVALADRDERAETFLVRLAAGPTPKFEPSLALARVAYLRGDRLAAEREARRAISADPDRVEGWDLMLRLADGDGSGSARTAAVDAILRIDQRARDLLLQRLREAAAAGDSASVVALGERAVYVDPRERAVHAALRDAYAQRGDTREATREADVLRALDDARGRP